MRFPVSMLAMPLLALSLRGQGTITIHAKVVDWRGRPAPGSLVSLSVVKHTDRVTALLSHRAFQVVAKDGSVAIEGPAGTWEIEAFRTGTRRGYPSIERNVSTPSSRPSEFAITASNTPDKPMVLKLGLAQWNVNTGTATWMLDMTTCTQGQTFRMDEIRAIPMR